MVDHIPLNNDISENLEGALWYSSLDMASEYCVVGKTERAIRISIFVTLLRLSNWFRNPFGRRNAPDA